MNIVFTRKAQESLLEIGRYLLGKQLTPAFVRSYLEELRAAMVSLLETFPDAGVHTVVGLVKCRRLVVKGYSLLYQHEPEHGRVSVLLVFRENLPVL